MWKEELSFQTKAAWHMHIVKNSETLSDLKICIVNSYLLEIERFVQKICTNVMWQSYSRSCKKEND